MFRAVILSSVLLLSGCAIFDSEPEVITKTEYVEKPLFHPELPRPVGAFKPNWMVITKETIADKPDNFVAQGLEWDQGQDYRIWLEDVVRYIQQLQSVACSYRDELEEEICKRYKDTKSDNSRKERNDSDSE